VYVDPEAIVFGSFVANDAKDIRIFGGGTIDGSLEERITENCYEDHTKGNVRLYNCKNVNIEDVILTDSATWSLALFGCENVNIDTVKIVGQWRYNTDGIDIVNSKSVNIKNSFVRSFDDTVTLKGIYSHPDDIRDITIESSVFWCGWGHTCEIGIETDARAYRNITFKNCDIIHASGPALATLGGNGAVIENIAYESIRVEFQSDTLPEILQKTDAQVYDGKAEDAKAVLLRISNEPYAIRHKNPERVERHASEKLGAIRGVRFKDIQVFTDSESIRPCVDLFEKGCGNISDIRIENLVLNGKKQTDLSNFNKRTGAFSDLTII
jgi:hypothetical protein